MSDQMLFGFVWMRAEDPATPRLVKAFKRFHRRHPRVWSLFQRFTLEVIVRGYRHYGAKAIFERLRWHVEFETQGTVPRLNNNHAAYYARMFEAAHPEHAGFFKVRNRIGAVREATAAERDLMAELAELAAKKGGARA